MKRQRPTLIGMRVKAIFTTKYTCYSCGRSFTVPRNESGDGIGECEHCGCTSYRLSDGRPWGRKHRFWQDWVRHLYQLDKEDRITKDTLDVFIHPSMYKSFVELEPNSRQEPGEKE